MRLMDWPSNSMASSGRGSSATTPDLARLGDVTRVRMIQTMNLLNHAPDIREEILFLPRTAAGRDPVSTVASDTLRLSVRWDRQRRLRREVCEKKTVARGVFPAIGKADCHSRDITGIFLICGTQEMPCPRPHCVLDLFSGSESIVTPYRCCSPDGLCGRIVGRRQAHARPTRQTRRC